MVVLHKKAKRRSARGPRRAQWRGPQARRRHAGAGRSAAAGKSVPDVSRYAELGLTDGDVALGEVPDI